MTIPRRLFLKQAGAAFGAVSVLPLASASTRAAEGSGQRHSKEAFHLAAAGYTFNKFKLEPTLEMLQKVDVHFLCIKDFHLPLQSTDEEIAAFHARCKAAGVTGYGVGPIYMGSEPEVNDAFSYARRVGVKILVGVPYKMDNGKRAASAELLQAVNRKVQEYDIKYAIHNHGPDMPGLFPTAESAMEMIKDMDKRVGLCLDIGHQFRDGRDPVQALVAYADRVHDIHIKNVSAPTKAGKTVEMSRGQINIVEFVRALRRVNYSGMCSLEFEKDMDNPLAGIAESFGYFKGVMDATR